MKWFKKKETEKREAPEKDIPRNRDEFSTNLPQLQAAQVQAKLAELYKAPDLKPVNAEGMAVDSKDYAMDSCTGFSFSNMRMEAIAPIQLDWFGSQTFIGHQACGIIAQHWLVQKACDMPARDAIRNGYELTFNGGEGEINPEIKEKIRKLDKKYKINKSMREYVKFGRVYGIRVALFSVDIKDIKKKKEYYAKPFNIDGVKPGTYNGIVQIDPEWITPELDLRALNDPTSAHFYEPTFWRTANGLRIHRSHLSIFVNGEVTDMLKPMYQYGGAYRYLKKYSSACMLLKRQPTKPRN